jgi:septum formation topological specificity factor MinE
MSGFLALVKKSFGMGGGVSRSVAKERLSLMLVTQRSSSFLDGLDMEAFQAEVAGVVQKYMKIANEKKPVIAGKSSPFILSFLYIIAC